MHFVLRGRQCGKIDIMVKEAIEHQGILIVINEQEKKRILHLYREQGLLECNVVSWGQREKIKSRGYDKLIFVDNMDFIMEQMLGRSIDTASLTKE